MNVLDKQIVVKLNAKWQAFQTCTVAQAVTFLHSESHGRKPGFVLDYETTTDSQGNITLTYVQPISWEEWIKLPVREHDLWIGVGKNVNCLEGRIRAPLVVICANYSKLHPTAPRLTAEAIRKRDGNRCQYTDRELAPGEGNLDHVQPRSRGGKNTFENLVWADKHINTVKGNRTPEEAGLSLKRKPVAPKTTIKILTKKDAKHPSQLPFLI